MPRYYFNIQDGRALEDLEGEDLADIDEARACAIKILSEVIPSHMSDLMADKELVVHLLDEHHRPVYRVLARASAD